MKKYESNGLLFTEKDGVPKCSYCGESHTRLEKQEIDLYETKTNNTLCCTKNECVIAYGSEMLVSKIEKL